MNITADKPFLVIEADVAAPYEIGHIGAGTRRCVPITGGRVSGELQGEILPGADWQLVHDDGNLQIEAHYAFRTTSGDIVEVTSLGVRAGPPKVLDRLMAGAPVDASEYYFRTAMRFRTGAPSLRHLNYRLAIARGQRRRAGVVLEVFEVL
jgi:Protein of unknown function (DUF3237)